MVVEKEVQIYPGFEECVTQHQPKRTIQNLPDHPLHLMVVSSPASPESFHRQATPTP